MWIREWRRLDKEGKGRNVWYIYIFPNLHKDKETFHLSGEIQSAKSRAVNWLAPFYIPYSLSNRLKSICIFALHLYKDPEAGWDRDPRPIKCNSRGNPKYIVNIGFFSEGFSAHINSVLICTELTCCHGNGIHFLSRRNWRFFFLCEMYLWILG